MRSATAIERLFERLGASDGGPGGGDGGRADIERVSALLLVEIARADHAIDAAEREAIRVALERSSALDAAELDAIVDAAFAEADATLSLHAHAKTVNERLDRPAKVALVEQMWRVALADGDVDRYEEYTIRKLADLLYLKHRDFMQAKLRVLEGGDGGDRDPSRAT